jgi:hypothetical protein
VLVHRIGKYGSLSASVAPRTALKAEIPPSLYTPIFLKSKILAQPGFLDILRTIYSFAILRPYEINIIDQ